MPVPVFILAGQSNAARLSNEIEEALVAEYGAGNFELLEVYDPGAPLTRERADQPDWSDPEELRDEMTVETVNALLEDDDRVFGGLMWIQGEADTYNTNGAERYAETLETLFDEFRADVSDILDGSDVGMDKAPLTILELSENAPTASERDGWEIVIDGQRDVAAQDEQVQTLDPDVVAEDANVTGSEMFDDGLHYSDEFSSILATELVKTLVSPSDDDDDDEADSETADLILPVIDVVSPESVDADSAKDEDEDDEIGFEAIQWLLGLVPILGLFSGFA